MSDFTVMEDTLLKPFATLTSCRNTIESECPRGLTRDECVEKCRASPFCSCGYFIKPKYTRSYCAPLNVAQLKNMNIHLNTFKTRTEDSKDPTKDLWEEAVLFYRPEIYPPPATSPEIQSGFDLTILMQRDICNLYYVYKDRNYYLQQDLTFLLDGDDFNALRVLFIDKFPQFYELANNVQTLSNFVLKIFEEPEILTVKDKKLTRAPYMVMSGEQLDTDTFLYIEPTMNPDNPILGEYPVLKGDTPFQITIGGEKNSFLGIKRVDGKKLEIEALPLRSDTTFPGHFRVVRKDIQPNIFKVADILDARLTFLQESVSRPGAGSEEKMVSAWTIAIIVIVILLLCFFSLLIILSFRYRLDDPTFFLKKIEYTTK